jgi:hypothetical protein
MRLSYIHQAYGYSKNDFPCGGSNPGPSGRESSALPLDQGAQGNLTILCIGILTLAMFTQTSSQI